MADTVLLPPAPGARFVRADLHVHTHADSDENPEPDLVAYVDAALAAGIEILAITDHNSIAFVRAAVAAAADKPLTLIPGIEISTRDGHLLALFDPAAIDALESFATTEQLKLKTISATERRSERSVLDLVEEIDSRGGLAILAHVDAPRSVCENLRQNELADLFASPALAGVEFTKTESLAVWFTDGDEDTDRAEAWRRRQADPQLKDRGLARLMSSDAQPRSGGT